MHDTPKKALFARDTRAFSHGCVRMQDPVAFAGHLLGPEGWTERADCRAQLDTQGDVHNCAGRNRCPLSWFT